MPSIGSTTDEVATEEVILPAEEISFIDPKSPAPSGAPCEACGSPIEPLDRFCLACGTANPRFQASAAAQVSPAARASGSPPIITAELVPSELAAGAAAEMPKQRHIQCQTCGAEVAIDPDQRSYTCAFCDSTLVVEHETSRRQAPEFVIGFAFTPEQAKERFHKWLHDGNWFRPGDLVIKAKTDQFKGVYLPFWSFSMLAQSIWQASIGMYWYRTETYTTTDSKGNTTTHTRQVRDTEWFPLSGEHHHYYSGYLVSGSKGLSQKEADLIMPYQLPAARRYEPYFLAGWISEEYSIDKDQALVTCQEEFKQRERQNIAAFMPGDTHSSLKVGTQFSFINSDLWFIPVYLLHYGYHGKTFRVIINGQTGKLFGKKPISVPRILLAIGVVVGLIALVVGGIVALNSR
jgi:predicted RNA-binding Zn-ribbon protein involved in translation (DUF1610 family)